MKTLAFKIILIINVLVASFAFSDVIEIGNIELKSLLQKKIPLIDIRRKDEWKSTGIVENSILMTFFDKDGKANNFILYYLIIYLWKLKCICKYIVI